MKRREFLKSMTALTAAGAVSAPAIWSPAKAQARNETLLLVTENGPNNLDIHGVGTNRPGYEASWNCYDRLITQREENACPTARCPTTATSFAPELAEDMNVGDMSVTFKLQQGRQIPGRHAGHRQGREMVVRPRGRVGGFPTVQMKAGSLRQARAVRRRRRRDLPRRSRQEGPAHRSRSRGDRARHLQFASCSRRTPPTRTLGRSNTPRATPPAAAPTR